MFTSQLITISIILFVITSSVKLIKQDVDANEIELVNNTNITLLDELVNNTNITLLDELVNNINKDELVNNNINITLLNNNINRQTEERTFDPPGVPHGTDIKNDNTTLTSKKNNIDIISNINVNIDTLMVHCIGNITINLSKLSSGKITINNSNESFTYIFTFKKLDEGNINNNISNNNQSDNKVIEPEIDFTSKKMDKENINTTTSSTNQYVPENNIKYVPENNSTPKNGGVDIDDIIIILNNQNNNKSETNPTVRSIDFTNDKFNITNLNNTAN